MKNRTRTQAAFTLIELLVVITIILLLAGLLVPVIKGSYKKANRVQCSNNVRQIASALLIYSDNNKLRFPAIGDSFTRKVDGLTVAGTYVDFPPAEPAEITFGGADPGTSILDLSNRPLNMYLHQAEVFLCPSDNGSKSGSLGESGYSCYEDYGSSYLYAVTDIGSIYGVGGKKRTYPNLGGAPSKILVMDIPFQHNITSSSPPTSSEEWHDDDLLKCMAGFMDGHAEWVEADTSFVAPAAGNNYNKANRYH